MGEQLLKNYGIAFKKPVLTINVPAIGCLFIDSFPILMALFLLIQAVIASPGLASGELIINWYIFPLESLIGGKDKLKNLLFLY